MKDRSPDKHYADWSVDILNDQPCPNPQCAHPDVEVAFGTSDDFEVNYNFCNGCGAHGPLAFL
ncbi:hypothetical protein HGA64_01605 [Candidatus Falkowbacteria bacterium]|nr:hypothetical protein [Candidatus Falkowbacteria bacterium]